MLGGRGFGGGVRPRRLTEPPRTCVRNITVGIRDRSGISFSESGCEREGLWIWGRGKATGMSVNQGAYPQSALRLTAPSAEGAFWGRPCLRMRRWSILSHALCA